MAQDWKHCCIRGCPSISGSRNFNPEIKFFRFPKNEEQSCRWVGAIGEKTSQLIVPGPNTVICSRHFLDKDMGKKKLLLGACPSIFNMENESESVICCSAGSCYSNACRNPELKFHLVPKVSSIRQKWIAAVNIQGACDPIYICSLHFTEMDYCAPGRLRRSAIPKAVTGGNTDANASSSNENFSSFIDSDSAFPLRGSNTEDVPTVGEEVTVEAVTTEKAVTVPGTSASEQFVPYLYSTPKSKHDIPVPGNTTPTGRYCDSVKLSDSKYASLELIVDASGSTELRAKNMLETESDIDILDSTLESLTFSASKRKCHELEENIVTFKKQIVETTFGIIKFIGDDAAIRHQTGFPSYAAFKYFFDFLGPAVNDLRYVGSENSEEKSDVPYAIFRKSGPRRKLSPVEEFYITMLRLRLGLPEQFIANLYGISIASVSKTVNTWILFLCDRLSQISFWPTTDYIQSLLGKLPPYFEKFPKTKAIVDCTEFFIERPSAACAQRETFSAYKHHNTAKALVAIDPMGVVTFVSDVYAGRVSDKKIIYHCGILDRFEEGDMLMVDRGFDIKEECELRKITLAIPAFKSGQSQFRKEVLQESRDIARCRVHSERAIRRIKEYKILSHLVPISLMPMLPKIFRVCAMLTNFTGSIFDQKMELSKEVAAADDMECEAATSDSDDDDGISTYFV